MSEAYKNALSLLSRVAETIEEGNVMQEFEHEVWVCLPRDDWEWLQELGHIIKGE